ncbi:extensin [Enterobacterales bacterium CwR94]|nr:extensin [Enterobacterales bacterium CwR94]
MKLLFSLILLVLLAWGMKPWFTTHLPAGWNPFTPLALSDPPTWLTRYKLKQLASEPDVCMSVLQQGQREGLIRFRSAQGGSVACPLADAVRIERFGRVSLSSSFLASCPLAVSSAMFVHQQAVPSASNMLRTPLTRIDHMGSFACRNIYHRAEGRRSEHATADAWDISGFRFANGTVLTVQNNWARPAEAAAWMQHVFNRACDYYGNALGPNYNAAHANHFHMGMRGFNLCR